jgi:hypothetical protein
VPNKGGFNLAIVPNKGGFFPIVPNKGVFFLLQQKGKGSVFLFRKLGSVLIVQTLDDIGFNIPYFAFI